MEEQNDTYNDSYKLSVCCFHTVRFYAVRNPMIMCQGCKHIIKCFIEERAFLNYVKFCQSRGRNIVADKVGPYHVVIFRAYEPNKITHAP